MSKFTEALKKAKPISAMKAKAGLKVLGDLKDENNKALSDKLNKVTVMADSKEGLKNALETSKEVLESPAMQKLMDSKSKMASAEDCPVCGEKGCTSCEEGAEHESMESPEMEVAEHEDGEEAPDEMTEQDIDEQIKQLLKQKEAMKSKMA